MNIGPILRAMKHNRTRVVLIVLEIAMTLAIVTNCVNVILAEKKKMAQPSGFDDANIFRMHVRLFSPDFRETARIETTSDADLRTIHAVPGVIAASNTHFQFWEGGGSSSGVKPVTVQREPEATQIYWATSRIVETLGAKITEGRGFRAGDHGVGSETDPANIAVISRALAEAMFPDGNAVGKQLHEADDAFDKEAPPITVVGVIDQFYNPWGIGGGDQERLAARAMFLPARVGSYERGMSYLVRVEPGTMENAIAEIEKRLSAAHPGRVFEFERMAEKRARWFGSSKLVVTTMTCVIITLVAVTTLGLLGLTSLAVAERRKQIGTRRALGATRADILRHFLVENWLLTTAGIVLGIVGAYALNFLLVSNVSDVKMQWQLVAAGVVLLWVNGVISTVPPAMRAMAVPPSTATRSV